jgi:DNA (cytosine-5)-methyltransferase 1
MVNLLCEHSELFSETWPISGMMLDGKVFALPTQAHLTTDSEFSSLPTPNTMDSLPARSGEARERQLHRGGSHSRRAGSGNLREDILELMPTPVASEGTKAPSQQTSEVKGKTGQVWLSNVAKDLEPLMATPQARDSKGRPGRDEDKNLNHDVARHDLVADWGKFEPAIRRWESIIGRPAPAPTKPDGKDGAHRLSSEFTEWMMGVPARWITGVGLSRNDELKACGNGVVPQQAELALRMLLEGVETTAGGGADNVADSNR